MKRNWKIVWKTASFLLMLILVFFYPVYFYAFLFIIIHEMIHLLAALCFHLKLRKTDWSILGMKLKIDKLDSITTWKKICIILAGPCFNLIVALTVYFFFDTNTYTQEIFYVNVILLICNMLPIYPLDGGNFLYEILKYKMGKHKALNAINKISNITLWILTLLYSIAILYFKNIFILLFLIYLAVIRIQYHRELRIRNKIIQSVLNYNTRKKRETIEKREILKM